MFNPVMLKMQYGANEVELYYEKDDPNFGSELMVQIGFRTKERGGYYWHLLFAKDFPVGQEKLKDMRQRLANNLGKIDGDHVYQLLIPIIEEIEQTGTISLRNFLRYGGVKFTREHIVWVARKAVRNPVREVINCLRWLGRNWVYMAAILIGTIMGQTMLRGIYNQPGSPKAIHDAFVLMGCIGSLLLIAAILLREEIFGTIVEVIWSLRNACSWLWRFAVKTAGAVLAIRLPSFRSRRTSFYGSISISDWLKATIHVWAPLALFVLWAYSHWIPGETGEQVTYLSLWALGVDTVICFINVRKEVCRHIMSGISALAALFGGIIPVL